jgi:hypothetical protein
MLRVRDKSRVMTDGQSNITPCFHSLLSVANRIRHKVAVKVCVMLFDNANTDDKVGLSS